METPPPFLSVIVVCKNEERRIAATLQSIIDQQYAPLEIIVKDGMSTDATVDVAHRIAPEAIIVQKPDHGVYDAMNQALPLAKGQYILFLNCGDAFYTSTTLKDIPWEKVGTSDIIYANVISYPNGIRRHIKYSNPDLKAFLYVTSFCHQGMICSRKAFDTVGGFNAELRTVADWEWTLRCTASRVLKFARLPRPLAVYGLGGISSNGELVKSERRMILPRYYPHANRLLFRLRVALTIWRMHIDSLIWRTSNLLNTANETCKLLMDP